MDNVRQPTQDISFKTECGRFNYRIGGVIMHHNKVLLLTEDRFDFWYLPGGRAYMFESSEQALRREIEEELGEAPVLDRLLWTTECMYHFVDWDNKHHDLTFYYLVHLDPSSIVYQNESGVGTEKFSNAETTLRYRWFPVEELQDIKLVPEFMKNALADLPDSTQHIILNELEETNAENRHS